MDNLIEQLVNQSAPIIASILAGVLGYRLKAYKTTLSHKAKTEVCEKDLLKMLQDLQASQAKLIAENAELKLEVRQLREIIERYERNDKTKHEALKSEIGK